MGGHALSSAGAVLVAAHAIRGMLLVTGTAGFQNASLHLHTPQALNNLAAIYTGQGRAQEALQLLQAAIGASPQYAGATFVLDSGVRMRTQGSFRWDTG